jgi:hypothetical protein
VLDADALGCSEITGEVSGGDAMQLRLTFLAFASFKLRLALFGDH